MSSHLSHERNTIHNTFLDSHQLQLPNLRHTDGRHDTKCQCTNTLFVRTEKRPNRILSSHVLLEGVDREKRILSTGLVVIAVMCKVEIDVVFQLHTGANHELYHVGEVGRHIHTLAELLKP